MDWNLLTSLVNAALFLATLPVLLSYRPGANLRWLTSTAVVSLGAMLNIFYGVSGSFEWLLPLGVIGLILANRRKNVHPLHLD